MPLVPAAIEALSPGDERMISLLVGQPLPPSFDELLRRASAEGPAAYVEADFFGGIGRQGAIVWDRREVVLGPVANGVPERRFPLRQGSRLTDVLRKRSVRVGDASVRQDWPINQALRKIGVRAGDAIDEFAALGLGRCGETDDWLNDTSIE